MLSQDDLKGWLHRDFRQLDKLLLVLASFDRPAQVEDIRDRAATAGLKMGKGWNPSSTLGRSKGLAIAVPGGWELSQTGKSHLLILGVSTMNSAVAQVATDLRRHLANVKNDTTRAFVDEAIKCHEAALYRSAIVMSWIAAVDVLHRTVVQRYLAAFNREARAANPKWRDAVNEDGIGRMGEEDFLNRAAAIGMLGKNQKDELLKGLKLRNGCGHPNSLKVGPNMVASHLEMLILNVFETFAV